MAAASSSAASSGAASSSAARESESDVESDVTVAQHVHGDQELDEAHWDAEGGGDGESGGERGGARGGVNSGDSGGESDDAEGDSGDSGDGGGGGVHISHRACGDGELYVVSVAFAPSGGGKAPAKRHQFVYLRHLEWYLDGTSGRSTSRLQKRFVTMGVANTLRNVEAKSVRAGELSGREWSDLLAAYMEFQRACDPLCTTARRFTLVPVRIAAMVAQDEGNPCY
mmetsp:Transcript_103687/g.297889  ORF Transcript_103687/g.297889 Transcript_103687/m.297889 type:complete len:226 (-) Transcript_103687:2067-2744(-)